MMTMNPDQSVAISHMTLEHLLAETGQYLSPREMETIQRAYMVANEAHRGVVRRSGDPYIQHPLEVALLLADMRIDADGIVAALLHDVVEDTDFTLEELLLQFGEAVADIVDGVTKFDVLAEKPASIRPRLIATAGQNGDKDTFDIPQSETAEQVEQQQKQAR